MLSHDIAEGVQPDGAYLLVDDMFLMGLMIVACHLSK
jgi:hypothetical protein